MNVSLFDLLAVSHNSYPQVARGVSRGLLYVLMFVCFFIGCFSQFLSTSCTGSVQRRTSLQFHRSTSTTRITGQGEGGDRYLFVFFQLQGSHHQTSKSLWHACSGDQARRRGESPECDNVARKAVRVKVVGQDELSLLPAQVGNEGVVGSWDIAVDCFFEGECCWGR